MERKALTEIITYHCPKCGKELAGGYLIEATKTKSRAINCSAFGVLCSRRGYACLWAGKVEDVIIKRVTFKTQ